MIIELKPCPFCGGDVSFHKDEECPGCHLIQCGQCRAFFDFATGADPGNDCASVDALRAAIVPMWNARAQPNQQGEAVEVVVERLQMQLVACGVVALANTPESAARARDMHPDYMSASCSDVMMAVDREMHQRADLLDWAVERWHAEVSQRPLVNVNRRSIDDTWRQIIRKLGGDPVDLCGPDHDTLLASAEGGE